MSIYTILIITHLVGTVLGIGGATLIELQLKKALEDKKVSEDESAFLGIDYTVVRVGLILSLISGFGFLLLYQYTGQTFKLHDPILWAKIMIILIIAVNALMLQAHKISLYWGAAFSFVSWWSAGLLGVFLTNNVKFDLFGSYTFVTTFLSVILVYVIVLIIGAKVLDLTRRHIRKMV